jgi:superoxide reductase
METNWGVMSMDEKLTEREIEKGAKEPAEHPVNTAEGEEKHVVYIGAPKRVIAGETFEVIVTVIGIPSITYKQPHTELIELYLHDKLMGRRELTPLKDEEMESIFKIEAGEALLTLKEIETSGVHEANISGNSGEKSVITNLRALICCNIHGVSEATQEIEVLPEKLEQIEEVKNVFVKPGDKDFFDKGP